MKSCVQHIEMYECQCFKNEYIPGPITYDQWIVNNGWSRQIHVIRSGSPVEHAYHQYSQLDVKKGLQPGSLQWLETPVFDHEHAGEYESTVAHEVSIVQVPFIAQVEFRCQQRMDSPGDAPVKKQVGQGFIVFEIEDNGKESADPAQMQRQIAFQIPNS